jgi:hypothetical protein
MDNPATRDRDDQDEPRTQDKRGDERGTDNDDGAPAPFAPDADDDTPLGDTDEHSDA